MVTFGTSEMAQVKGTAVQASLRYVKERFGEDALARVLAALPSGDAACLAAVLPASWYPMPTLLHFMEESQRQLAAEEPQLVLNMGRASCDYGVRGVYRVFFKVGSPEFIIGRAAAVYSSYYDSGELKVVESRPGHALVEVHGLSGAAPQFCERIYGWMQRTLELAGARNLRSAHVSCVHRGDPACRFEGNWD